MVISFKDQSLERLTESRSSDTLSPSLVAKRDLERYYVLLDCAEKTMPDFSNAEYSAIYDCCNGAIFEPYSAEPGIWCNVQDACIRDGLAEKWKINGEQLVTKLRKLSPLQAWAIVDKIERYWR